MQVRRVVLIVLEFCGVFAVLALGLFIVANNQALRARLAFWWQHRASTADQAADLQHAFAERPPSGDRIVIPKVGVQAPILSPTSSDQADVLAALEHGVARYP